MDPKYWLWFYLLVELMSWPSTGSKMFCAGPNFLNQSKNLIAFRASSKTFVREQKPNLLNGNHLLVRHKKFGTCTMWRTVFGITQKNWTSLKCFGTYRRTRQKYFLNFYPSVEETTISFWNFLTFNQLYKDSMTIKLMFLETCLSVDCCDLFSFEKVLVPGSLLNGPPS